MRWPIRPCASVSPTLVMSSRRARSRHPRVLPRFTSPNSRNGGRSCRRPTSSRSDASLPPKGQGLLLSDALAGAPKLLGRCRHFELRARFAWYRIRNRVHQRGDGGSCACLSCAFHSQWIRPRRNKMQLLVKRDQVIGARQRIIHERTRHQLSPESIIDGTLHHRLPETLCDGAMTLPRDNHVVERVAAIVHRNIAQQRKRPRFGIDLHLRDVAAIRKRERRLCRHLGIEIFGDLAAPPHLLCPLGKLEQRNGAVGPDHSETAVAIFA